MSGRRAIHFRRLTSYAAADTVFRRVAIRLALITLPFAAACGRATTTPTSPLSIAGSWTQGARLQDSAHGQTHIHTGSFAFVQRGESFTGAGEQSGLCHDESAGDYTGPLATGAVFQITAGVQHGASVRFTTDLCSYEGTVSTDGKHIAGTASCSYTDRGTLFHWQGDWLADRGGER